MNGVSELFPEIEPYKTERFSVSPLHTLYLEQSGNPQGKPVIYLHGGPGSHTKPKHRQFFDPRQYRIILFDQRGCGQSTPLGELRHNTTQDLISDMEKIRHHLGVEKWMVFGGSWGSTLALAYAQMFPKNVSEVIVYGIFLSTQKEINWLYEGGPNVFFPDKWEKFKKALRTKGAVNVQTIGKKVLSNDIAVYEPVIEAVRDWESSLYSLFPDENTNNGEDNGDENKDELYSSYKIAFHYFMNHGFLRDGQLLDEVGKLRGIPGVIIHGRYDLICPMETAWQLHRAWPEAAFEPVALAGHRAENTEIIAKLVESVRTFAH